MHRGRPRDADADGAGDAGGDRGRAGAGRPGDRADAEPIAGAGRHTLRDAHTVVGDRDAERSCGARGSAHRRAAARDDRSRGGAGGKHGPRGDERAGDRDVGSRADADVAGDRGPAFDGPTTARPEADPDPYPVRPVLARRRSSSRVRGGAAH